MAFDYHTDPDLLAAYRDYQGQDPLKARCIFVGSDANFTPGEDWEHVKLTHLDYLTRGPDWCVENNRHHPLAPEQGEKNLNHYHGVMASLFTRCTARGATWHDIFRETSFVDLLRKPTTGSRRDDPGHHYKRYLRGEDNQVHLTRIYEWLTRNDSACLVIPRWILDDFLGAIRRNGVILADVRCRRTLVVKDFPYFAKKKRPQFKNDCLNSLAAELANSWHH